MKTRHNKESDPFKLLDESFRTPLSLEDFSKSKPGTLPSTMFRSASIGRAPPSVPCMELGKSWKMRPLLEKEAGEGASKVHSEKIRAFESSSKKLEAGRWSDGVVCAAGEALHHIKAAHRIFQYAPDLNVNAQLDAKSTFVNKRVRPAFQIDLPFLESFDSKERLILSPEVAERVRAMVIGFWHEVSLRDLFCVSHLAEVFLREVIPGVSKSRVERASSAWGVALMEVLSRWPERGAEASMGEEESRLFHSLQWLLARNFQLLGSEESMGEGRVEG